MSRKKDKVKDNIVSTTAYSSIKGYLTVIRGDINHQAWVRRVTARLKMCEVYGEQSYFLYLYQKQDIMVVARIHSCLQVIQSTQD